MNGHVEVVRLEVVGHLAEALERVLTHGLLEAERLPRLAALLRVRSAYDHHIILSIILYLILQDACVSAAVPLPHTWGSASLLWARPAGAGSGRRCGSCRHSRHTAGGGPPHRPAHTPCTYTGRSEEHTHAPSQPAHRRHQREFRHTQQEGERCGLKMPFKS